MHETEIESLNILRVAVGTTGLCGGDSGHGGRTRIEIEDLASTDINCWWDYKKKKLTINLGGDSELDTIIRAFDFISEILKKERILKKEDINSIKDK